MPPVMMSWSPSLRCPPCSAASRASRKRSSRVPACSRTRMELTPHTSASLRTVSSRGLTARILLGGRKRATLMQESPDWVEVSIASASRSSASSHAACVRASWGGPGGGRAQYRLRVEVRGERASGVREGVVVVAPAPGGRGRDVPAVVDGAFGGPADPLHLLYALHRVATHGRLPGEHHGVGPIEDRVRDVGDLGARGP